MSKSLKIYYLDENYINYLRSFDSRVAYNKNMSRPYVGVVYTFNGSNYFAPLSSPKPKHIKMSNKAVDIFKIKNGELGIININNMIPTPIECITEVLPTITDKKYKTLVENQTSFINDHKNALFSKIKRFTYQYKNGYLPETVMQRCCDFEILETKCKEYIENQNNAFFDFTNEEIETAMELAYKQTEYKTNNISFEFEDYIVNNPFYNNETMEELSIEEAIEIYGKENVEQFIASIIEEQSNKHGGRSL